jgi:hypothetical protein
VKLRILGPAIKAALTEPAAASEVFDVVGPLKGLPLGDVVVIFRRTEPHETPGRRPGLMIVRVLSPTDLQRLAEPEAPVQPSVGGALGELAGAIIRALTNR